MGWARPGTKRSRGFCRARSPVSNPHPPPGRLNQEGELADGSGHSSSRRPFRGVREASTVAPTPLWRRQVTQSQGTEVTQASRAPARRAV